jgi:hypothetical protein
MEGKLRFIQLAASWLERENDGSGSFRRRIVQTMNA